MRKATVSFVMSVRPSVSLSACNNSAPIGRILMKLDIRAFFENLSRIFKFRYNPTKIKGTLREDVSTFLTISRWVFLVMGNVLDKSCRENKNTRFMFSNFLPKIVPFMNVEKCGEDRGAIWLTRISCWISKATCTYGHTHAPAHRYHTHACMYRPISNTYCFSTATMIRERASMLSYTYIVCLVR